MKCHRLWPSNTFVLCCWQLCDGLSCGMDPVQHYAGHHIHQHDWLLEMNNLHFEMLLIYPHGLLFIIFAFSIQNLNAGQANTQPRHVSKSPVSFLSFSITCNSNAAKLCQIHLLSFYFAFSFTCIVIQIWDILCQIIMVHKFRASTRTVFFLTWEL